MSMERTDAQLTSAALDGDTQAFQHIVELNSAKVFAVAYRIIGNEPDAEEVVQETFIRAYQQLDRFDGRASLSTWLYRIASNRAIDLLRSRKRQEAVSSLEDHHHEPGAAPQQDILVNNRAVRKQLWAAMDKLSMDERTAFVLRHFEQESLQSIAATLGIRPNAAKNTIFRAVRKLRLALEPLRTL